MTKLLRPRADGGQDRRAALKRTITGTVAALATMAVLTVAMLPLRGSLGIATTALILVVPVVIGVVVGGFLAGVLSVVAGFLVYDFFFIPPYHTFWVGAPVNWVALGVYLVVMIPVARVVAGMNAARAKERRQGSELRELFAVSGLLLEDKPLEELLPAIVTTLADVFGARQVALLLPGPVAWRWPRPRASRSARSSCARRYRHRERWAAWASSRATRATCCCWPSPRPGARSGCWPCPVRRLPAASASRCCCSPTRSPSPWNAPSCASRRCGCG